MAEKKFKYVKVERYEDVGDGMNSKYNKLGTYIVDVNEAHTLIGEINEAENGYWTAKVVWLTAEEIEAIPDFEGY